MIHVGGNICIAARPDHAVQMGEEEDWGAITDTRSGRSVLDLHRFRSGLLRAILSPEETG